MALNEQLARRYLSMTLPSGSGSLGEGTVPESGTLILLLGGVFALGFCLSRA